MQGAHPPYLVGAVGVEFSASVRDWRIAHQRQAKKDDHPAPDAICLRELGWSMPIGPLADRATAEFTPRATARRSHPMLLIYDPGQLRTQ